MTDYFTEYTEVLENKLGISDPAELNKAEAKICFLRQIGIEAELLPIKMGFNFFIVMSGLQ
jgi:fido (protein-threonine AMPylation protein)